MHHDETKQRSPCQTGCSFFIFQVVHIIGISYPQPLPFQVPLKLNVKVKVLVDERSWNNPCSQVTIVSHYFYNPDVIHLLEMWWNIRWMFLAPPSTKLTLDVVQVSCSLSGVTNFTCEVAISWPQAGKKTGTDRSVRKWLTIHRKMMRKWWRYNGNLNSNAARMGDNGDIVWS